MTFEKLQNYLAIIANFGVIAGLALVVVELNQNTNIAEVNAYQNRIRQVNEINHLRATDEGIAALDMKAQLGEPLTPLELRRYRSFYRLAARHGDVAYLQFKKQLISEEQFYGVIGPLRDQLRAETGKAFWADEVEYSYIPGFTRYINKMMADLEPDNDFWKELAAE